MKVIYKYPLNITPKQSVTLYEDTEILSITPKYGGVFMWACHETDMPAKSVEISMYGTGHKIPDDPGKYIGTVHLDNGLVFHYFAEYEKV